MPTPARRSRQARTQLRTRPPRVAVPPLDVLEATLRDWLGEVPLAPPPRRPGPGRRPVLPAMLLWTGLLVCLLRGLNAQLELWRLLTQWGLWDFPRVAVGDMAVYKRLERTGPASLQRFFAQVSALIRERLALSASVPFAAFATEILALDQTVLEPVLRQLKGLRALPVGDHRLLPGVLNCLFDVRRQQWWQVAFSPEAMENEKPAGWALLAAVPKGALLLFDLGYFAFPWFDQLGHEGYFFVSRLRQRISWQELHGLYEGGNADLHLRDALIYLGTGADRAALPLRLIQITRGQTTYRYLTNVLDPRQLPAWQVVALYQHRWDIEKAFDLLKSHLGLHLLWSAHPNAILQQVLATLILAQVVLALRQKIAQQAGVDVREVSLALMLRTLPRLAAEGKDPLQLFVQRGRAAGCIRPFRSRDYGVPKVAATAYRLPERWPPRRRAKYGRARENPEQARLQAHLNACPPDPGALLM